MLMESSMMKLTMSRNAIGDIGIEHLHHALYFSRNKLHYLNLSECEIEFQGFLKIFDSMKQNYQLRTLILDGNKASYANSYFVLQAMLTSNRCLEHLSFMNCEIDNTFVFSLSDGICHNHKVKTLNLSCNRITDEGAISLGRHLRRQSLIELNLSRNKIEERGGEVIAEMLMNNASILKCYLNYNMLGDKTG